MPPLFTNPSNSKAVHQEPVKPSIRNGVYKCTVILSSLTRRDELSPEMNGFHCLPVGGSENSPGQAQRSSGMQPSTITRPVGARRNAAFPAPFIRSERGPTRSLQPGGGESRDLQLFFNELLTHHTIAALVGRPRFCEAAIAAQPWRGFIPRLSITSSANRAETVAGPPPISMPTSMASSNSS